VARLVRLDEVVLEEDGLELVVGGDEVDGVDLVDERHRLRVARAAADEVRLHAIAQVARLADVDHLSLGVLVQIDAGAIGDFLQARFQGFSAVYGAAEFRISNDEFRMKNVERRAILNSSFELRNSKFKRSAPGISPPPPETPPSTRAHHQTHKS